jgi:hypothetical protein
MRFYKYKLKWTEDGVEGIDPTYLINSEPGVYISPLLRDNELYEQGTFIYAASNSDVDIDLSKYADWELTEIESEEIAELSLSFGWEENPDATIDVSQYTNLW